MKSKTTSELSEEQKIFLQFFRKSLSCDFNWDIIDPPKSYDFWKEIADLSAVHHVLPMIYEQVHTSKVRDSIDSSLMKDWKFRAVQSILTQEKNTACFLEIFQKLQNAGFHPLVVKGIILRSLYRNPEYRSSSDEDVWILKEEYAGCEELLQREGFVKAPYSNEEKMAFDNKSNGFHMEVHLVPFGSGSGLEPMNAAFEGCFERGKAVEIQGVKIHTLCHEDHVNYMIGHCFQHFSSCGVGIRQIADLMKYAEAYGSEIRWTEVEAFTKRYHLYEFWKCLMAVAKQYLGFSCQKANLPERYCTVQEDLEDLMVDILSGGIYGKTSQERIGGSQVIGAAVKKKSLLVCMWDAVFLSPKRLKCIYPWIEKRPYLIPIAWMLRILEKTKKYKNKTLINAVAVGNYRTQLAKKYHFI